MSNDEASPLKSSSQEVASSSGPTSPLPDVSAPPANASEPQLQQTENRVELLSRAKSFLLSPQVQNQDIVAKRRFLVDKGLTEPEVEGLLRELPPQIPQIPPRTYPQLPPSNLPTLFIGIVRIFSWILGGSATLLFLYHRFLLPRISRTAISRQSLKSHHLSLLRKFTTSLATLKESQAESFAVLPRPQPYKEPPQFSECSSIDAILKIDAKPEDVPPITLLRCGIADFCQIKPNEKPTTEELFQIMEAKIPWLTTSEGVLVENTLWETLTTCPLFEQQIDGSNSQPIFDTSLTPQPREIHWIYHAPTPPEPSPILSSLSALSKAMPAGKMNAGKQDHDQSAFQRTLQTLSDFTGYISTQVYLPYRPPGMGGMMNPAEDEMRREIRALKGLVLNRRSFMPSLPQSST